MVADFITEIRHGVFKCRLQVWPAGDGDAADLAPFTVGQLEDKPGSALDHAADLVNASVSHALAARLKLCADLVVSCCDVGSKGAQKGTAATVEYSTGQVQLGASAGVFNDVFDCVCRPAGQLLATVGQCNRQVANGPGHGMYPDGSTYGASSWATWAGMVSSR